MFKNKELINKSIETYKNIEYLQLSLSDGYKDLSQKMMEFESNCLKICSMSKFVVNNEELKRIELLTNEIKDNLEEEIKCINEKIDAIEFNFDHIYSMFRSVNDQLEVLNAKTSTLNTLHDYNIHYSIIYLLIVMLILIRLLVTFIL